MVTPVHIIGKSNERADVIDSGLVVSQVPAPASSDNILTLPYVNFLTVNGDGVTESLLVDGSVTPVDAFVSAEANADVYISTISVVITDSAGAGGIYLNEFGGLPRLTNGIIPFFQDKGNKLAFAERPLYTNFDFVRIGTLTPQLGQDENAFRIRAERNSDDYAYVATWDMTKLSPYGLGLRMAAGTKQRVGLEFRDDITSLSGMEVLCTGYRRFVS